MSITRILKAGLFSLTILSLSLSNASAADYNIDPTHGFVEFKIPHMGISLLSGRFNKYEGTLSWDQNNPSASSIEVKIDTTSVDTNHAQRDEHISAESYLNVAAHPTATFKSTKYEGNADSGKLMGDFTLNGITKSITIDVTRYGEGKDNWGGYRVGFSGETTLKGGDFYKNPMLNTDIAVELSVEAIQKK